MIQINNKTTLIILTSIASILLLAQPVSSYQQYAHRIFPVNLLPSAVYFYDGRYDIPERSKFSWRYIQGVSGKHKALTVEQGPADNPSDESYPIEDIYITPNMLNGNEGYEKGLKLNGEMFYLRKFNRDGTIFFLVTLEDLIDFKYNFPRTNEISPYDLVGTAIIKRETTEKTKFNWKYVKMIDGKTYRTVVLEN